MNKRKIDLVNAMRISEIINKYFNVQQETSSRKMGVMIPRQISQFFMRRKLNLTYKAIANIYNLKQHGTVMSNIDKIDFFSKNDKEIAIYVTDITHLISKDEDICQAVENSEKIAVINKINSLIEVESLSELYKIKEYLSVNAKVL